MSKDLFIQLREQEIMTDNFLPSKKEITKAASNFAKEMINKGEDNLFEKHAEAIRLKEALTVIEKELRDVLPKEKFEHFGVKAIFKNGGDIPQYADDPVYVELKEKLKAREELLKTVLNTKEEIYDKEGILVPIVSTKPRASSLNISF